MASASASTSTNASSSAASASSSGAYIVPSRLKEPYVTATCPYVDCRQQLEYLPPSPETLREKVAAHLNSFSVSCSKCKRNFDPPGAPRLVREARSGKTSGATGAGGAAKRRIGTDEKPLDTT